MQFDSTLLESVAYIDGEHVSFQRLFEEASGLVPLIVSEFGNSDFVGIQTKTSSQLLTFILGVWMADKTPVLFHPKFPFTLVETLVEKVGIQDAVVDESRMNDLVNRSLPSSEFPTSFNDSKIASVVFTSGSTGIPKAVAHSFLNHFSSALGSHENTPFQVGDRWAASLPMCHVGGLSLFFRSLIKGGAIVFLDGDRCFSDAVVESEATHLSLIPTQLQTLIKDEKVSFLKQLKLLLIGGAPMPDPLFDNCVKQEIPIRLTYGMTETASQFATSKPGEKNCGRPLSYRNLKIEDGQIFVGGEILFQGYIEKSKLIPRRQKWFASGDLGYLDEDGNLHVNGRIDNMFISGGENIQPEEIEKAMLDLGLFSQAFVVPVEDAKFGFRPFAFVDTPIDLELLHRRLEKTLPKFMWPIGIDILPEKKGLKVSRSVLESLAANVE